MSSAVITADIVNSTLLDKPAEKKLIGSLKKILTPYHYEFYRGDSLQVYMKNAGQVFHVALLLRSAAKKTELKKIRFDIKISIGIGSVKHPIRDLRTAKGQAFILSGRSYDNEILLKGKRMTIHCGKEPFDTGFEILADYTDDILNRLTTKQAEIIYELLAGHTQYDIAKQFKKSQPTISKQARAANWYQLQDLLAKFERLIKFLDA